MLREELSEEKRKEYDALTAKMMREIEEELASSVRRKSKDICERNQNYKSRIA